MILNFKNRKSEFELIHIKWVGIQYDRKKLKKFIRRYNILRILSIFSKIHKHELKVFRKIIKRHGKRSYVDYLKMMKIPQGYVTLKEYHV